MKVLYISHRLPYPPDKGERIRAFNELKFLSEFCEVHLCSLLNRREEFYWVEVLKRICRDVRVYPMSFGCRIFKAGVSFVRKKPLSIEFFYSKRLQQTINRKLLNHKFNSVICFSSSSARYTFNNPFCTPITDFVDMDSMKWVQYGERARGMSSLFYRVEAGRVFDYEKSVVQKSKFCIFVSERERDLFLRKTGNSFKKDKFFVLENGVDFGFFSPDGKKHTSNGSLTLLFTGTMDYYPNVDAVVWFVREVLPLLLRTFSDLRFYIAGASPHKEVKRLSSANVVVTGYVKDIRQYYDLADVYVAPLRIAQGVQNKILEAMSMRLPVVATSKAVEGLKARSERDLLVADTRDEFILKIFSLLMSKAERVRIGKNAREYVLKNHNWKSNLEPLKVLIEGT